MSIRKREWLTSKGEPRVAWIVDYRDASGTRRLKTFKRQKDAATFAASTHLEVRSGTHVADSASVTVSEAGEKWLASCEAHNLERATIENYRRHLRLHVEPFLGGVKLPKLTVPAIRQFEDRLRAEGRSGDLIRKVMVSLSSILSDAQDRGLTVRNPVREKGRRRNGTSDRHKPRLQVGVDVPAPDEIRKLFQAIEAPRLAKWRPLIITAALTGLRASELRGLRWSDVDLDRGQLHVRQRADRFGRMGPPKSKAGQRTVPLPPTAANVLREWRLVYPRPKGEAARPEHLVFGNSLGRPEMLTNILRRGLWPACGAAGINRYSMHALRHWFASWCINPPQLGLGLPPKVVQERLGHSTIAMTMDTYGHIFPRGDDADEMAAAERALLGAWGVEDGRL